MMTGGGNFATPGGRWRCWLWPSRRVAHPAVRDELRAIGQRPGFGVS